MANKSSRAFTLIEMLIVIAIIAVLIAVSVPMITGAVEDARIRTDEANEKIAWDQAAVSYMTKGSLTDTSVFGMARAAGSPSAYYDAVGGKWVSAGTEVSAYGKCSKHGDGVIGAVIGGEKGLTLAWYDTDGNVMDENPHDDKLIRGFLNVPGAPSGSGTGGGDLSGGGPSGGGGGGSSGAGTDEGQPAIGKPAQFKADCLTASRDESYVSIVWSAVPNAEKYLIERSLDKVSWDRAYFGPGTISGTLLKAEETVTEPGHYYYRIKAYAVIDGQEAYGNPVETSIQVDLIWRRSPGRYVVNSIDYVLDESAHTAKVAACFSFKYSDLVIPDTVTVDSETYIVNAIEMYAFSGSDSIKRIKSVTGNIKSLDYAFASMSGLETVEPGALKEGVISMEGTFMNCRNLNRGFTIPSTVTTPEADIFLDY